MFASFGLYRMRRTTARAEEYVQVTIATTLAMALFGAGVVAAGRLAWTTGTSNPLDPVNGTVEAIGDQLFRRWVLPFEITALLLIVAAAGAIALAFFTTDDDVEVDS